MTTRKAWFTAIIMTLALMLGFGAAEMLARAVSPLVSALMGG